jgi:hypothetical protein
MMQSSESTDILTLWLFNKSVIYYESDRDKLVVVVVVGQRFEIVTKVHMMVVIINNNM